MLTQKIMLMLVFILVTLWSYQYAYVIGNYH